MNWSTKSIQDVVKEVKTRLEVGLSEAAARERLKRFGPNTLPGRLKDSWLRVFFRQFASPLIYVLVVAAAVIFFVGKDKFDAFVVSGVLFFNAIVGTFQEGRAQSILEGLRRFIKISSVVLRDGKKLFIENKNLVVGDLILLQEGERVPADARIVESNNIQIDESVLTGESEQVSKVDFALEDDVPVHDQKNMVFKGTYILSGSGRAVVVAIGVKTQIGQIYQETEAIDTDMPLKKEITRLSYWILWSIFALCVLLFFVGLFNGRPISELLTMLTALFICVVPEGLPVVLTLVLSSGVYAMARRNVLVKRMQGVEALGRADVIIIDKTGTLTRNEMVVSKIVVSGKLYDVSGIGYFSQGQVSREGKLVDVAQNKDLEQLGKACAMLNRSEINFTPETNLFDIKGSPTEIAMMVFARKLGFEQEEIEKEHQRIYEMPFDSIRKYHAIFCKKGTKGTACISGVPEKIIKLSRNINGEMKQHLGEMLKEGLRVVAVATKTFDLEDIPDKDYKNNHDWFRSILDDGVEFLGFCGIQDSIRPEVAQTIEQSRYAGIRVIMATGDHKKTALFVAKQVGIFTVGDGVLEGAEFEKLSGQELDKNLLNTTVYSRVTPKQKLKLVNALRAQGNIVAMTGDGVNDVPALVAADLGIAMGKIGTEAAKQAADIILLDDSFVSIVNAIEYGRHIFYTLRRVVLYFFSTNMGEVFVVLFALLLGMPLPLTAVQILWLNIVTDGFLDVAIATEKKEEGLLKKEARSRLFKIVDWGTLGKMFFMALPMTFFSLYIFSRYYGVDIVHARSMVLVTMAMFQWFNALNCRSETKSIFQLGLFANRWLLLAMSVVLGLQVLVLHNKFMQRMFKTVPISFFEWGIVIAAASTIVILEELRKLFMRWWRGYIADS